MDHSDPVDSYLMFTPLDKILARREELKRQLANAKPAKFTTVEEVVKNALFVLQSKSK